MTKDDKQYEVVGNIRIKQPKTKKSKKKRNTEFTPLWTKILVWFMFIAMAASFIVPLVYYFMQIISAS